MRRCGSSVAAFPHQFPDARFPLSALPRHSCRAQHDDGRTQGGRTAVFLCKCSVLNSALLKRPFKRSQPKPTCCTAHQGRLCAESRLCKVSGSATWATVQCCTSNGGNRPSLQMQPPTTVERKGSGQCELSLRLREGQSCANRGKIR